MHRPPDTIPTSGPVRKTRAGLIVPIPPKGSAGSNSNRRHSVISFSARDVTAFPIRTNDATQKGDKRRPSDIWLSIFSTLKKIYHTTLFSMLKGPLDERQNSAVTATFCGEIGCHRRVLRWEIENFLSHHQIWQSQPSYYARLKGPLTLKIK